MKAYLTTVGERTTDICRQQLERYGFEVIVLADKELWINKYRRFLNMATEECLRIDADCIMNQNILKFKPEDYPNKLMIAFTGYDFYKNNVGSVTPIFYRPEAIEIIKRNFNQLSELRPETWAWRLPEINDRTVTLDLMVGLHGFWQSIEDVRRAMTNKKLRNQMLDYDFDLIFKIMNL
jgi:hypothetical protein